ncbi:MAG: hypothetical protein ABFS16_14940 [Bacteroidota bacterium]
MKKLFFILVILGITLSGYADLKPKQIVGKWKYEVDAGGELLTGIFKFAEKEGKLVGEIISDDGYNIPFSKIECKEDNKLYMEAKTDYDLIKIDVKVDGDKFSGMGTNYEGEAPITGKKVE